MPDQVRLSGNPRGVAPKISQESSNPPEDPRGSRGITSLLESVSAGRHAEPSDISVYGGVLRRPRPQKAGLGGPERDSIALCDLPGTHGSVGGRWVGASPIGA
jgi:hypothetical protein